MDTENLEIEEKYGRQLRRARAEEEEENSSLESEEFEKGGGEAPAKNHTVTFVLALLVAVISDLADVLVIGAIPLVGDALDAATGAILGALFLSIGGKRKFKRLLPSLAATLFEFLPFGITDIMPTYTIEVIITWYMVQKENRASEQ